MRRTAVVLVIIVISILVQNCATYPIFYHSEASLPYAHSSTKTIFKLLVNKNSSSTFSFGVISAKDNDSLSYVLFAPSINAPGQSIYVNSLTDANLTFSIPLLPTQVEEFIKVLNSVEEKWNSKYNRQDGISYEFLVVPEDRIVPRSKEVIVSKSKEVVVWYSTFKFYFKNNDKGPLVSIIFGDGAFRYLYKLDKLSEVKTLTELLKLSLE